MNWSKQPYEIVCHVKRLVDQITLLPLNISTMPPEHGKHGLFVTASRWESFIDQRSHFPEVEIVGTTSAQSTLGS